MQNRRIDDEWLERMEFKLDCLVKLIKGDGKTPGMAEIQREHERAIGFLKRVGFVLVVMTLASWFGLIGTTVAWAIRAGAGQ